MRENETMTDDAQQEVFETRAFSEVEYLLHQRLRSTCWHLFMGGDYRHVAREAMTTVELALREKALATDDYFGGRLIDFAFGGKGHVQLTVPYGGQDEARALFRGAFKYYRNYAAHDGAQINRTQAARILVLASELLDLLAASPRSLRIEGGPEGLVLKGIFSNVDEFRKFLIFIDGQNYPDDVWDGFFEALASSGYSEEQVELVIDLGLLEITCERAEPSRETRWHGPDVEALTIYGLTKLGREILKSLPEPKESGAN